MTLRELQPDALLALDAAIDRGHEVVDPDLLALVTACVEHHVAGGPAPSIPGDDRSAAVAAVVEQMLVDVAGLDDVTVQRAAAHFDDGGLSDLVMTSYAIEARTRLRVAGGRLLGSAR